MSALSESYVMTYYVKDHYTDRAHRLIALPRPRRTSLAAPRSTGLRSRRSCAFYPQAGIPWHDLYFGNFVDLDPGPGVLDWNCGSQTYDGHSGEDSLIRSFREKRIGVPVFAALDGVVVEVQSDLPDEHVEQTMTPVDNHVIIKSLGGHVRTVYGHLRRKPFVRVGQRVARASKSAGPRRAATAPGRTCTSRRSSTSRWYEPFAGPCRAGQSYWREQPPLPTAPYARDFTFSPQPFGGRRDPPWDEAVRTGTFTRGTRDVYFRIELGFFDGSPMQVTFTRPDGSVALDGAEATYLRGARATWANWHERARPRPARHVASAPRCERPRARRCAVRSRPVGSAPGPAAEPSLALVGTRRPHGRRRRPVPRADIARHGGPGLRRRALPLPVARRRQARPRRDQCRALGCAPPRARPPGRRLSCTATPSDGKRRGPVSRRVVTVR